MGCRCVRSRETPPPSHRMRCRALRRKRQSPLNRHVRVGDKSRSERRQQAAIDRQCMCSARFFTALRARAHYVGVQPNEASP
jgi:hypothetical protein